MDQLVSVVVPVYKVERYLDRCVSSIVSQTYQNLEILLVDDGSPDRCPEMCDAWKERDPRVRVIHQKNQGQCAARNTGLKGASGAYLCFVDSDDYIEKDYIRDLLTALQSSGSDIAVCGHFLEKYFRGKLRMTETVLPKYEDAVLSPAQVRQKIARAFVFGDASYQQTIVTIWAKLYRYSFLSENALYFRWRSHDDWQHTVCSLAKNPQFTFVKKPLYHYCRNMTDVTVSQHFIPGYYEYQVWNDQFFKENFPEFDYQCDTYYKKLRKEFIDSRMHILLADITPEKRQEYLQKLEAEPLYQEVLQAQNGSVAEDTRLARKMGRSISLKRKLQRILNWLS